MSFQRRLLQILSSVVILTMLFSGFSLPSALAQEEDGIQRQISTQTGKLSQHFNQIDAAWSLSGSAIQDTEPTPTPLPTESPLTSETLPPTQTPEPVVTAIPTLEEPASIEEVSAPDEPRADAAVTEAIWYVSLHGNNLHTCDNPASPCATINGVLAKPGFAAGDTINVAVGVYAEIESNGYVVSIKKSVRLRGGWDSGFISQTGFSIIDGENSHSGIFVDDFPLDANETSIDRFIVKDSMMGIYNTDQLMISNSSIHSNSHGGITHFGPSLILNNVVISHNRSDGGEGGGIMTGKSSIVMNNVTISENQAYAGGGIYYHPGYGTGTLSIQMSNTILAGNTSTTTNPDCNGPITSLGHNIIGNTNGCAITASVGDQLNVNPRLGAFLPELGFHPLRPDSPAINAGSGCYGTTDQRGVVRIDTCDIGAYEYIAPGPVASLSITGGDHQTAAPNTPFANPLRIVAQDSKGNLVSGVPITFTAPANGPSAVFISNNSTTATYQTDISGVAVTSPVRANSQLGSYEIAVSALGITNSVHFTLENLAWYVAPTGLDTNSCKSPGSPCATLDGVLIKIRDGDKIFVAEGVYTGNDAEVAFINKSVTISGGWNPSFTDQAGVSIVDGQNARKGLNIGTGIRVSIEKFVILNGLGAEDGGGINNAGELTLNSVGIANNTAVSGGGIRNAGNLTLNNVTIANNTTSTIGGGIYNEGVVNINNTTISNNSTKIRGGGIYNRFTQYGESQKLVQIKNSIIAGNIVTGDGSSNSYGPDCAENIVSLGNNIIGSASGCNITATSGDKFNVSPKLSTFIAALGYQPLQAGSPAINAGNSSACPAQDQRGSPRVGVCDIGAYEYRTPGAAVSIRPAANNLRLRPGAPAAVPLRVVAIDQWKTPVNGVVIAFSAPLTGPGGVFSNGTNTISASTGADGIASTGFTTNQELGSYEIDAYSSVLNKHTAISVTNFGWFVANTGADSNDCYTPAHPCATINGALSKAINGDAIYVAEGRYVKTGNDYLGMIVNITKSVTIVGSWNATFTGPGNLSIIDGEGIYSGVANSAANVVLARLIVENVGDGQVGINNGSSLVVDQVAVINGKGTGVTNYEGTITIQNSTISQNQGPGLRNSEGNAVIRNSTITNNRETSLAGSGGGVRTVNGIVTISNSIIHGNFASEGPDCSAYTTPNSVIVSGGNNIIGTTSGCNMTPKTGDKFNTDPLLLPLLPLGYQPLSPGSPALHGGNPSTCTATDQRGAPRLTNGKCDIGAYELQPVGPATRLMSVHAAVLRTPVNLSFPETLKVVALDQYGTPVSGVVVEFSMPLSGPSGTFSGNMTTSVITDSQGLAISPTLTANGEYGDYVATVSSTGISMPVTISLHNGAWLVSSTNGNDSNNCLQPASPCASIKGVLDKNEFNSGEVIWVSAGTYDTASNYYIVDEVTIIGGWDTSFSSTGGATILQESYTVSGSIKVKIQQVVFQGSMAGLRNEAILTLENATLYQTDLGITNSLYGNLTLVNVTMSKNSNIALRNEGEAFLLNSTITENRGFVVGGIRNEFGVIRLKNTIVAGNIATNPADYASADCQGEFISLGHNIIGTIGSYNDVTHNYDCRSNWMDGDILGSDNEGLIPLDQIFDTNIIQDPDTGQWVYPLKADGIAIDAGFQDCPSIDQRGISRPQGSSCDIGAYESIPLLRVTKVDDSSDGICDDDCSLREAIHAALDGDKIYFDPALSGATITLGSRLPGIDKSITINAGGRSITIDGAGSHRIFEVLSTGRLSIHGLTLQNGSHIGSCTVDINDSCGGAIYNSGTLTVTSSTFSGNSAEIGGAIFVENGTVEVSNSTFTDNSAIRGGSIYNDVSALTLTNNTFADNSAVQGADIYNAGSLHFTNNILANSALGDDCYNENGRGEVLTNISNLVEANAASPNNCGTPAITTDPKLGSLADNGGFTHTMALGSGSPAIDVGNDAYCPATDQRGVKRPQGNHCDLGAYEFPDTTPPTITSVIRASADHTSAASVSFSVKFSESVLNVNANDFSVRITGGISSASVSSVTGSGATWTVTVNTGTGNGTLRLDVPANASIIDTAGNPVTGLPFVSGQSYTILKAATFSDVETKYWAWQYVERLVNAGITSGCGNGDYCSEGNVTRAQMAVFLLRGIHGSSYNPPAVGSSTGFGDVSTGHWAGAWIKQLAAEGITSGCGNGNYCPESSVTREQMAVFLLRAKYGVSYSPPVLVGGTGFGDVDPSHWAGAWIKQLVVEGITTGCGSGTYCPKAAVTRAQMAVFLVRTFNLP